MTKNKASGLDWLDRTLLTSPYCYALCLSEDAYIAELKRLDVPKASINPWIMTEHSDATVHYFDRTKDAGLCAIVCVRAKKGVEREQIYSLLVHEAVHLWRNIKLNLGEDWPAAEEEAYAIQRIAQSLMYSYKEQTKRRK